MVNPVLIVPGIGFCKVFNGDESVTAWPPAFDAESFMKSMTMRLAKMAIFRKDSGFSDMLAQAAQDILAPFSADETGTPTAALFTKPAYSFSSLTQEEKQAQLRLLPFADLCEALGEENVFFFPSVFSADPLENGRKLSESIEAICSERGCERVSLLVLGCAGTFVTACLADENAKNRIDRLVFCFSALDGSLLASDLFLDSLDYRKSASFLCSVMKQEDAGMFIELNNMIPGLLETVAEKVFTKVRELFLNLPAAWALVPSDDYNDLAEELLADKAQLKARTDAFHALRCELPRKLQELCESGVRLHILAGSALSFVPLSKSSDVVSDTLVNTSSAALNPSITETADPTAYEIDADAAYFSSSTQYFPGVSHLQALKNEKVQAAILSVFSNEN